MLRPKSTNQNLSFHGYLAEKRKTQVNQSALAHEAYAPSKEFNPAFTNQQVSSITSLFLLTLIYKNLTFGVLFYLPDWMLPD